MGKNQHKKNVISIIQKYCDDYETMKGKKKAHLGFILKHNGKIRKISTGSTPSDNRSIKNFEADVKRTIREMEKSCNHADGIRKAPTER